MSGVSKPTGIPLVIPDAATLRALPSRREFLRLVALGGTLIWSGSLFAACEDATNLGGLTGPGTGAALTIDFSKGDVALLQFLFVLEQLEAEFYSRIVAGFDRSDFTSADKLVFTDIANHEAIHRAVLAAALGKDGTFRITPAFGSASFTARASVLEKASGFEALGVSAYNGILPYFTDAASLALALKIASVEGRHSASIRDLISPLAAGFAPTPFDVPSLPTSVAMAIQPLLVDKLAFASAPASFAVARSTGGANGQAPSDVVAALQAALLLTQLQSDFYQRGATVSGLIPSADTAVFSTIAGHEAAYVTQLQSLISSKGAVPQARPAFDYTAKGNLPGFAFLASQFTTFAMIAQALEDLAVRAWKGELRILSEDADALAAGISMHTVQARHASEIRRLRGKKGWITGNNRDDLPAFMQAVYDGEENTVQGSVNAASVAVSFGGTPVATEAFDEALSRAQVMAFLAPFLP